MLRLAIYGHFGSQNIGNECTLRAVLVNLRKQMPEMTAFCICSDPVVARQEHDVEAVAISVLDTFGNPNHTAKPRGLLRKLLHVVRRTLVGTSQQLREMWRAYRLLKGVDTFVLVATGMLEDSHGSNTWPLTIYRWTLAARLRRCRIIALGIGAGPFETRTRRVLSTAILRTADYVSYRDQESKDCVSEAGLDTSRHTVVPDLAFSLPLRASSRADGQLRNTPVVALGVIDRSKFSSDARYRIYLEKLCAFAEVLIEEGSAVRVIHGDGLYDKESILELRNIFASKGALDDGRKLSIPPIASLDDLLTVLEDADIVVASRYHNMILALMLAKPVIALSYHWKFASVMSRFNLSRYVQPVREFELSWLLERSRELLAEREDLAPEIRTAAEACRASVMNQYRTVWEPARACRAG